MFLEVSFGKQEGSLHPSLAICMLSSLGDRACQFPKNILPGSEALKYWYSL